PSTKVHPKKIGRFFFLKRLLRLHISGEHVNATHRTDSDSERVVRAVITHIHRRTHIKRRGTVIPVTSSTVTVVSVAATQRL
ncbi:hypothetical protein J6590_105583, partial [Homalodisca vitripennis]